MTGMAYTQILYSLKDGVARIAFNDPATLNASNEVMSSELLDALDRAASEAGAIVLTGEGRSFCSGANLGNFEKKLDDPRRDIGQTLDRYLNPAIIAIKSMELPVVTAVKGPAAGVGCGLALSGDIIVCGEKSYFYFAFRHVGLLPDGGSSYLLSKAVERVRAMDIMLRGKKVYGPQALDWGLVTEVVADDAVDARAMEIARELASGPRSLSFIRQQAWLALDQSLETALNSERLFQRKAGRSEDFAEGVRAFGQKRKPEFKGR